MDPVAALLGGPHARGAFLLRSVLRSPWSMRIADEAPLTVLAVLRGAAWVVLADGRAEQVPAGDVVLLRGPRPYTVADDPGTAPQVLVGPGQVCTPVVGSPGEMSGLGARAWGNDPEGDTVLLHDRPAEPWTVASLAAAVGVARATLARRFTDLVGEPPMSYLTGWRIALATDLLRDPQLTLTSIARRVGYASPFALSAAFKRATGLSPAAHRATLAAAG